MQNGVQLIAYADRLGTDGIAGVSELLSGPLDGVFTGVHLLPFYRPIDGADAGFDPTDHTTVDARLGAWEDVTVLSQTHEVMADLIINHISDRSPEFQDFIQLGDRSKYADMFLTVDKVFPGGASTAEIDAIYRTRPGRPFTAVRLDSGRTVQLWATFTPHQIDLDVESATAWDYVTRILDQFADAGIKYVRLGDVGYAVKRRGTSCFMIPETYDFIERITEQIHQRGMETLAEIHGHFEDQLEVSEKVDWVYDFALPSLILDALHHGSSLKLARWLEMSPLNAITVLGTHDGIGVSDVAASLDREGLLDSAELDRLVETVHMATGGQSQATRTGRPDQEVDQINSTYLAALGSDEQMYLAARLIQFFSPGVPQIYYAGLLATPNDMIQVRRTGVERDINRPRLTIDQVNAALDRPVVRSLCKLARFRSNHPAFGGDFTVATPDDRTIELEWTNGVHYAGVSISTSLHGYSLTFTHKAERVTIHHCDEIPELG